MRLPPLSGRLLFAARTDFDRQVASPFPPVECPTCYKHWPRTRRDASSCQFSSLCPRKPLFVCYAGCG